MLSFRRRASQRELRQRFIVCCDGKNTEPQYFDAIRAFHEHKVIIDIHGGASDKKTTVDWAVAKKANNQDDHVWAVFDCDGKEQAYKNEIRRCGDNKIGIACTNPCFELWLILHFEPYDKSTSNDSNGRKKLQKHLRDNHCPEYDPDKSKTPDCSKLMSKIETAEKHEKQQTKKRLDERNTDGDPSTRVGDLTKAIRNAAT